METLFSQPNHSEGDFNENIERLREQLFSCLNMSEISINVVDVCSQVGVNTTNSCEDHAELSATAIKQQQQRLVLLRHASKCPHENGLCPITPHCWVMKQLWKHVMVCKSQECSVLHCVSSRYVLSHYSKCQEATCPVCGPVREAIKRNYERARDIRAAIPNSVEQTSEPENDYSGAQSEQGADVAESNLVICAACSLHMTTGYRHHCDVCDIDYCQGCAADSVNTLHTHSLTPLPMLVTAPPSEEATAAAKEKARSVQLHLQLLKHVSTCVQCGSKNCQRMKDFLKHDGACSMKATGGCQLCTRITNLLNIHARSCRVEGCRVPRCKQAHNERRARTLRQQQVAAMRRSGPEI